MVIEAAADGALDEVEMVLLPDDGNHALLLEYGEASGGASVRLSWERVILPPVIYVPLTIKTPGTWLPAPARQR